MQIDYALILSAGLGTRMGEIGKKIPKVMWPIFQKTLLDLQIDYCRHLGVKKIFINTHFLASVIEEHIKKRNELDIVILHEDPLLDSGGAIHNLAAQKDVNYRGNVLLVNGDQFLLFNQGEITNGLYELENNRAVLFGINVEAGSAYNETVVDEKNNFTEIRKPPQDRNYVTYSGLGLLKLDGLKPVSGISKFFSSVCNFKEEPVKLFVPSNYEYWDFGTAEIYHKNIFKIFESKSNGSLIRKFLTENQVDLDAVEGFISPKLGSINLKGLGTFAERALVWDTIVQTVN